MKDGLYRIFLSIMDLLAYHFGYHGALHIKDIMMDVAMGCGLFILILMWVSRSVMIMKKTATLEREVALNKVEEDGHTILQINPKSSWDVFESFLGIFMLPFTPGTTIKFRTVRPFKIMLLTIMIICILLGILFAMWEYFPKGTKLPGENDYEHKSKQVSCLLSLDQPCIRKPVHLKLSSFTTSPGLSNE